ncbi:hypothetical protein GGI43DRAFT_380432 [Trichoderma evansii]
MATNPFLRQFFLYTATLEPTGAAAPATVRQIHIVEVIEATTEATTEATIDGTIEEMEAGTHSQTATRDVVAKPYSTPTTTMFNSSSSSSSSSNLLKKLNKNSFSQKNKK